MVHHARGGMVIGATGHNMSIVQKQRAGRKWCQALQPQGPPPCDPFLVVRFHLLKAFLPSKPALPAREPAFIQMNLEGGIQH